MSNFETADCVFTSSTGRKITLQGVSPFLVDKVRAGIVFPKPPTYTAATATGEIETYPHDETTLATDEDKKAWAAYQADLAQAQAKSNDTMARLILTRGVVLTIPDDGWREEQESFGIQIPDKPVDLKLHFIMTEVIGNADDLGEIIAQVLGLSTMDERAVEAARSSFRLAIKRYSASQNGQASQRVESQADIQ